MESAGQTNWRGKNIGCYVGNFGEDWHDMHALNTQQLGSFRIIGTSDFAAANRVSYEFDFKGPSVTVRTACSSSLTSLHQACLALYNGDCCSAIVAGSNIIMHPGMTQGMTEKGLMSPTGSCKTFDANADGYARGEAINAIYIKLLDDAIRENDSIRAVIRATASNCDGKTLGIARPSTEAQEALVRRAYEAAGIKDPSQTPFVECHGTGTLTGDPIETNAMANVFGRGQTYIGSVKVNVGHSEGASGLSSSIKAILALEHETIPPQINFSNPNPDIAFDKGNLVVPLDPIPWPKNRGARVSINSFGIAGANAHVILDSAASYNGSQPRKQQPSQGQVEGFVNGPEQIDKSSNMRVRYSNMAYTPAAEPWPLLIPVSADSVHSLHARKEQVQRYIKSHPASLDAVAYSFGSRVQWAGMAKELLRFSSFCNDMSLMDETLQGLEDPPSWSIHEDSQPLCTAVQVGLVNFLAKAGITPAAVAGHSSGEIAAAYAAGAISLSEAILNAYHHGLAVTHVQRRGAMAAVGMGRAAVAPFIANGVVLACENGPRSVTLSGDEDALERTLAAISDKNPKTVKRRLGVNVAYHSSHMQEIGAMYEEMVQRHQKEGLTTVPFYSSVTGQLVETGSRLESCYWRTLEGPLRQIAFETKSHSLPYVATLKRDESATLSLLTALGEMYLQGCPVNFSFNPETPVLVDVPHYPWDHQLEYWSESRLSRAIRHQRHPYHELLGSRGLESIDTEPFWRNQLRVDKVSWLKDHMIGGDILFPCVGYVAMMGEAIRQVTDQDAFTLRNLVVRSAMVLDEAATLETMTTMRPLRLSDSTNSSTWHEFSISTFNGTSWVQHCIAQAELASRSMLQRLRRGAARLLHIPFGPRFQVLRDISASPTQPEARASVASHYDDEAAHSSVHPTAIDGMGWGTVKLALPCPDRNTYNLAGGTANLDEFLSLYSHARPALRVLQVGAGTGTTENVLKALGSKDGGGTRLYLHYTLSDISAGILAAAEERFKRYPAMDFKMLDLSRDATQQGLKRASYDLVIVSNTLYATPKLGETLRSLHSLLAPRGRLLVQELGFLPSWWAREVDGQSTERFISLERWDRELSDAGFSRTDSVMLDDDESHQRTAVIVATTAHAGSWDRQVTFLCNKKRPEFGLALSRVFQDEGFAVSWANLGDTNQDFGRNVVSCIDLETPFFHDMSEADFEALVAYISKIQGGLFWLTRPAQIECADPHYGMTIGAARVIRNEVWSKFSTLELQTLDPNVLPLVLAVFNKIQEQVNFELYNADREFAVHDKVVYVGRYDWFQLSDELEAPVDDDGPMCLEIGQAGLLDTLGWRRCNSESKPLADDELEVEVGCVGLNFRDLLNAMGMLAPLEATLGGEASGIITRVGSSVRHVKVADSVMAYGDGCFATQLRMPGRQVVRVPDGMSLEDAASLPVATMTAIYCVFNVGHMSKGQSILIHSACGGVGLAALQVCRMLELEIYCTTGSDEKVQYLVVNCGTPRDKIFSSRDTSFLGGVLRATDGRGVDVVLNSRSGDLLHASWQCVAKHGKMVEIGKSDLIGHGSLALHPFLENRSFHGVDRDLLKNDRPDLIQRTMEALVEYYQQGHLKPIPRHVFPAHNIADAFRYMQSGQHIGKIIISVSKDKSPLPAKTTYWSPSLLADVKRAVEAAPSPIAGLFQMCMVLKDKLLSQMTYQDWTAVQDPKVEGTWNLHQALLGTKLDFFILLGSTSSTGGFVGQANYAAANAFQDSFVQYRHRLKLPCSVIDVGLMKGIGYAAQRPALLDSLRDKDFYTVQEQQMMDSIQVAISQSQPGRSDWTAISTKPLLHTDNRITWKRDFRMGKYYLLHPQEDATGEAKETGGIRDLVNLVASDARVLHDPASLELVTGEIGRTICGFLVRPAEDLDPSMSISSLGLDSLVSVEVSNWWHQVMGVDMTVTRIANAGTLGHLGSMAIDLLQEKYGVKAR
ncbi:polyketide synthase dehydratase domain-containing protein [Hirsutella rhossiliensis]|uniref:Polyketide synthase dehydratase domain-containing protein n=1 Tax=Hirsutella rhossiliensis TaxID=111463 RepID=A0A9P8SKQ9_9HYPO|nr:polyketide synthase dehydratase domain-containing protein [Hirsutella rhossiliensis]KAH0966663.1 polyketide synthase dehydratase domain-containing protein [Hirsutella rhossiliensis]